MIDDMGFPAGLSRTMVVDLTGRIPPGARFIRISTNLRVYWDRIRVDNSPEDTEFKLTEVPLAEAKLQFRGYPRVVEGNPKNDLSYVYEDVSATGPYARQIGNYTRFGDITDLMRKTDDEYVIFGSGDEVAVDFDSTHLPDIPERLDPRLFLLRQRLRQGHGFLCRARRHRRAPALPHQCALPLSRGRRYIPKTRNTWSTC